MPGPRWPAWRATRTRISIGSLVSPMTFRLPGPFAKLVATVDEMSGGRVEVGMGAGWNDLEHAPAGHPVPAAGRALHHARGGRRDRARPLDRARWLAVRRLALAGRRLAVPDAGPSATAGGHPPIILGGRGGPRLARLVARYARRVQPHLRLAARARARRIARIDAACQAIGRDPAEVTRSAMTGVLIAETRAELNDRIRTQLELTGAPATEPIRTRGWPSGAHAGSSARWTRQGSGCAPSKPPACSGSCCRTSSRATST